MLKFEGFETGTRVRCYDFKPMGDRTQRYVEGEITNTLVEHGVKFYEVNVTRDTLFPENPRDTVLVPMETSMDYDTRITVI